MRTLVGALPHTLLEQPVFDAGGHLMGRVVAVGTRRGELRRIGIEARAPEAAPVHFVARERFTVEGDRIVLTR